MFPIEYRCYLMPCHHYPSARPCLVSSLMTDDETNKKVAGSERHSPERSERLPLELVRGRTAAVQLCLEDKAVPPSQLPSKELPRSRQQRRRRMCNSVRACVRASLHSPCSCPSPHMGWSNRFKAKIKAKLKPISGNVRGIDILEGYKNTFNNLNLTSPLR